MKYIIQNKFILLLIVINVLIQVHLLMQQQTMIGNHLPLKDRIMDF